MGINHKDHIPSPHYCSLRYLVLGGGILSSMLSLLLMVISMVVLVMDNTWHLVMEMAELWLQENHWDIKVTHAVWKFLDWLDRSHKEVLVIIMVTTVMHFIVSLMLIFGTMFYRRIFLIPWMVSHLISIIIMVINFTCWTFMSFFIDLLLAIVYPVVGGLVLGLWIGMWRQVYHFSTILIDMDRQVLDMLKMQAEYQQVQEKTDNV